MFNAPVREKVAQHIIRQVREAILSGRLTPGTLLPPETELMQAFEVSRHTLREALRALEAMDLISVRKGAKGGPVVRAVDMQTTRNAIANFLHFKNVSLYDLSEVRRIVEPQVARRVAEVITEEGLQRLYEIQEATAKAESPEIYQHEIGFHVALGKITGNAVLILIMDFVLSLLWDIKGVVKPGKDMFEQTVHEHEEIIKALEVHDGNLAAKLMFDHVCAVESSLSRLARSKGVKV